MTTGKKLGMIIDVIINNEGNIKSLILEEKRMKTAFGCHNRNGGKYESRSAESNQASENSTGADRRDPSYGGGRPLLH